MVTIVVGSQWGDEGKGKIIDYLGRKANYIVRFHGGNNAGHTVKNHFGTFALHLIPAGVFNEKATVVISNGTVIDLAVLVGEIEMLEKAGLKLKNRFYVSPRCHIIMPYHKLLDKAHENAKGKYKTGTTGRGIGPVYADKVSYNGIRLFDLLDKKLFSQKLSVQLLIKNKVLKALGEKPLKQPVVEKEFFALALKIKPYIQEPYPLLQKAITENKKILFEGAQGIFLDTDWGTYPFVTAATTLASATGAGAGLPPNAATQIIGVVKAYTTRVGQGPFPTELLDKTGEKLRALGNEFGATTGRARRCGWFDAEMIRFAKEVNGFDSIILTKVDILDSFKEIKICTGYMYKEKRVRYYDGDAVFLNRVKPVYKTIKGWQLSTKGITDFRKLPPLAKEYLREIEKLVGVKISYISTGQETHEIIKV